MSAPTEFVVGMASPARTDMKPSLLRAERRRFGHRRFLRVLLLIAVVGYLVAVVVMFTQYDKPSPELMAQAQQRLDQAVAEGMASWQDCLHQQPTGVDPQSACGPAPTADMFGDISQYLPRQPFLLGSTTVLDAATAFGVGLAALGFLVGVTWIGAEWSSKNLAAWLWWEPRRLRVMAAKITVLAAAVAAAAFVFQVLWLGTAYLLATAKGSTEVPVDFWGELWALQGRLVLFAVLAALGGFALANLLRNSGAALGVAFLYFAVIETGIRALSPTAQQWLLTDNSLAFLQPGGYTITWWDQDQIQSGTYSSAQPMHEIFLSHWRGGLTVGLAVTVVLAVGLVLFRRRDLT